MKDSSQIKEFLTQEELEAGRAAINLRTKNMSDSELSAFLKGVLLVTELIYTCESKDLLKAASSLVAATQEKCGL